MKILCLGNNTEDSDQLSRQIAQDYDLEYHGLITDLEREFDLALLLANGVYHSTIFDCAFGRLVKICDQFDRVIMLDQPKISYGHTDAWLQTQRVMQATVAPDKIYTESNYWQQVLSSNPSFCILPWVQQYIGDATDAQSVQLCCRSPVEIGKIVGKITEWQRDPKYTAIRNSMLSGQKIPHCENCYRQERQGLVSDRQTETIEWVNRLDLVDLTSLSHIEKPAYYEVRNSDRCNLQCRMCAPQSSHKIAKEYEKLGWHQSHEKTKIAVNVFDFIEFEYTKKIYVAGGEPMLNADFFKWLDQCRETHHTEIECVINTNGTKLPQRFKKFLPVFPNLQFIFSIDAHDAHNDYIRWGSSWQDIIANWHELVQHGKKVHVNTTVSIYNVHKLSTLYQYIDQHFDGTCCHINLVNQPAHLNPLNFPDTELAMRDLQLVRDTKCYANNPLIANNVEYLIRHFEQRRSTDDSLLDKFFVFNDTLDSSRGSRLDLYDPVLAQWRR